MQGKERLMRGVTGRCIPWGSRCVALLLGVVREGHSLGPEPSLFLTFISDLDGVQGNLKLHREREAGGASLSQQHEDLPIARLGLGILSNRVIISTTRAFYHEE